jgi:nucleoside-diphosphate-sugar epimerase
LKQKISIIGCGWLGMPLAADLAQKGFIIKGSTTSTNKLEKLKSEGVIPYLIELNKLENNISEFLNSEILIISVPSKNIDDFKELIHHIENSNVKKVLFISSTSVYDNSNQIVTEETIIKDSPLHNIEQLITKNINIKSTIIRFGGLFGYDRKPGDFIPINKKMINPEGYVNLIHRDDCVQIIEQIIFKDIWNETLNACADSHPKRRDFYIKENLNLGRKAPLFMENSLNEYKIISSEKLKSILDFSFKYSDLMNY